MSGENQPWNKKNFISWLISTLAYIVIVQSVKEYQTWSKNETCDSFPAEVIF